MRRWRWARGRQTGYGEVFDTSAPVREPSPVSIATAIYTAVIGAGDRDGHDTVARELIGELTDTER